MKWDRACDCSTVNSAVRGPALAWPEPDFVIRYESGQANAFTRQGQRDRAQRVPFSHVYDHDDWRPFKPRGAVDLLADLA